MKDATLFPFPLGEKKEKKGYNSLTQIIPTNSEESRKIWERIITNTPFYFVHVHPDNRYF